MWVRDRPALHTTITGLSVCDAAPVKYRYSTRDYSKCCECDLRIAAIKSTLKIDGIIIIREFLYFDNASGRKQLRFFHESTTTLE